MIPRLKPWIGREELSALFQTNQDAVPLFEKAFADAFSAKHALAFPYGRSALWTFLKAMELQDAEIVQPAYTCSVVAHATVLSGNRPVFVDADLNDYNMNLEQFEQAINVRTRAVIPTHLFGYPMNIDEVDAIVKRAEKRFGQRIYIIQDCAHPLTLIGEDSRSSQAATARCLVWASANRLHPYSAACSPQMMYQLPQKCKNTGTRLSSLRIGCEV